jgi:hypothetical protein
MKIADTATVAPGTNATFTWFGQPTIDNGLVVFAASVGSDPPSPFGPTPGIALYTWSNGVLQVIANQQTLIPGSTNTFTDFYGGSYAAGNITFLGFGDTSQAGIYVLTNQTMTAIADTNTILPGTGEFMSADPSGGKVKEKPKEPPDAGANPSVVFCAFTQGKNAGGVYVCTNIPAPPGPSRDLGIVALLSTPIPAGVSNFSGFGSSEGFDGRTIAFAGYGQGGQQGIYAWTNGLLTVVADTNTPIPGRSGNFTAFSPVNGVSVSQGAVVFTGAGNSEQGGIYYYRSGCIAPIIQNGDTLGGKVIEVDTNICPFCLPTWWIQIPPLNMNRDGFETNQVGFIVAFPDQSSAIYVATVAERPVLSISHSGTFITISWEQTLQDFALEQTSSIPGVWAEVPGAVSPYSIVGTNPASFFRLRAK